MIIQVQVAEAQLASAVAAVLPFAIGTPAVFAPQPLPEQVVEAQEFEAKAQAIAQAIRPRSSQPLRQEALRAVLGGHDTYWDQQGAADPTLRNAVGALSKALRPFSFLPSPLDLLCTRQKHFATQEPGKGSYLGTRYVRTLLGTRVRDILKAAKAI